MKKILITGIVLLSSFALFAQTGGDGPGAGSENTDTVQSPAQQDTTTEQVDEDALFSDQQTVLDSSTYVQDDVDASQHSTHLGFSGQLNSVAAYDVTRNSLADGNLKGNSLTPYVDALMHVDARLPTGVKAFGSYELLYDAGEGDSNFYVREMFLDFNINSRVYFRSGKQVLQWGRCYLWNPTDMVNIEKKSFETKIGEREGGYGLKAHIPFGTRANIYAFLDTYRVNDVDQIAQALKFEFLLNTTEMAFSVWNKKDYKPVLGYDISTRLGKFDILGETSFSYGSNTDKVRVITVPTAEGTMKSLETYRESGGLVAKASVNAGRAFDVGDEQDKVQVNLECFYNGDGYSNNYFSDDDADEFVMDPVAFFMANNLYQPHHYSRYYAALFTTVNKFLHPDIALANNVVSNLEQQSFTVSSGLTYTDIHNFQAKASCSLYLGDKDTEYTFMNNALSFNVSAGFGF